MADQCFSAVDAALGYLYQVRCALLWTLKRQRAESPDFQVSIETLDDVTFDIGGEATELLQTKHHRKGLGSLTDASPDLWKTLRIWFEGHKSKAIPTSTALFLVTTAKCGDDSIAALLRHAKRNVDRARQLLDEVARYSTNETNKAGYFAFLNTTKAEQIAILDRVVIVDSAPSVNDLDDESRGEVYWAAGREHLAAFLQRRGFGWDTIRPILSDLYRVRDSKEGEAGEGGADSENSDNE